MEKLKELWINYHYQLIVGLAGLLLLICAGGRQLWSSQLPGDQAAIQSSSSLATAGSTSMTANQPSRVCIDVKGAVKRPGVYYFKRGARVAEALKAAGGPGPNAEMKAVNLAKELTDQQVVYVPQVGEAAAVSQVDGEGAGTTENGKTPINLNTASKEQLCQITGIGDKKADLILEYRQQHGQFKSVEELMQVSGFGEKTVAKIKDQVSV